MNDHQTISVMTLAEEPGKPETMQRLVWGGAFPWYRWETVPVPEVPIYTQSQVNAMLDEVKAELAQEQQNNAALKAALRIVVLQLANFSRVQMNKLAIAADREARTKKVAAQELLAQAREKDEEAAALTLVREAVA